MSAMGMLILGMALWWAAHLFKRVAPTGRARLDARLGTAGKGLIALLIVASVVLMILGYRGADATPLYVLPVEAWYANNLLMAAAIFLMDAGRVKGVVRTHIRHPMLSGVLVWAVAHLLVNGDDLSLILFGGLAAWAVVEMVVINRAEGPWMRPEPGRWHADAKLAIIAAVLYAVIVGVHGWLLGYSVLAFA